MKPENQHQLVLYYLYKWKSFSLKDVINDSMFFKMQTRLSEIETDHGTITNKSRKQFINRFGKKSTYVVYSAIDKDKIKELFELY